MNNRVTVETEQPEYTLTLAECNKPGWYESNDKRCHVLVGESRSKDARMWFMGHMKPWSISDAAFVMNTRFRRVPSGTVLKIVAH